MNMVRVCWTAIFMASMMASGPVIASDNSKSKVNPDDLLPPYTPDGLWHPPMAPPPWNIGPGYDPATGLPTHEPGLVDVSVPTIAAPVMGIMVGGQLVLGSGVAATVAGEAVTYDSVVDTVIGKTLQGAAEAGGVPNQVGFAFAEGTAPATQAAQSMAVYQGAMARLGQMIANNSLPAGVSLAAAQQAYTSLYQAFTASSAAADFQNMGGYGGIPGLGP